MSDKRFRLGIIFNFNPTWTGGIIYVLNTIKILNFLADKDKPTVVVVYAKVLEKYVDGIAYPYLEKVCHQFPSIYKGYLYSWLQNKNIVVDELVKKYKLKAVFPLLDFPVKSTSNVKLVAWYADLQHKYYPHFFSKVKRIQRNARIKLILRNSKHLVVSSNAVKDDFKKFYKIPSQLNFHVYQFVSIIDELPKIKFEELVAKYQLPKHYFMISNQFHKHKNHKVVFKALAELNKRKTKIHIAITGRFPSEPNSAYMKDLHSLINKHHLKDSISFLGLIPRGDQLLLMKFATAIIQPSLFEGWSTVIEDAKSLQVPVIASSLKVNIEQLREDGTYFEAVNHIELAGILENFPKRDYKKELYGNYTVRMKKAAYEFLSIFK